MRITIHYGFIIFGPETTNTGSQKCTAMFSSKLCGNSRAGLAGIPGPLWNPLVNNYFKNVLSFSIENWRVLQNNIMTPISLEIIGSPGIGPNTIQGPLNGLMVKNIVHPIFFILAWNLFHNHTPAISVNHVSPKRLVKLAPNSDTAFKIAGRSML